MTSTETTEGTGEQLDHTAGEALEPVPQAQEHEHAHDHAHNHAHDETPAPVFNPECTREVEVEVTAEEVSRQFRSAVKRFQKLARIPGFRAGKVPESLIRRRFAEDVRKEVIDALLPTSFRKAIEAQDLHPISQPQVVELNLEEDKPLRFRAAFEIQPEFDITGYDQVRATRPNVELTEEEFAAELERVLDSRSTMEPVTEDRALQDGDFAQITFKGFIAGEERSADAAAQGDIHGDQVTLEVGGKNTLDAFNEALRGAKPGQELKFELTYPEEFTERRLAGKTVAYEIEVRGIQRKILPELNDEFAKEMGPYTTVDEFKQQLRDHLAQEKKRGLESQARSQMMESLIERFQFPVPESLVQQQIDVRLDRGLRALAAQGMRADDMRQLNFARMRAAQRDLATQEVRGALLLDRIADAENISVSEEELDREIEIAALRARESEETLRKRLTEDGSLTRIREQLRREKTGALLFEKLAG